jgi:hypothetical protein
MRAISLTFSADAERIDGLLAQLVLVDEWDVEGHLVDDGVMLARVECKHQQAWRELFHCRMS